MTRLIEIIGFSIISFGGGLYWNSIARFERKRRKRRLKSISLVGKGNRVR